ncbi:Transmembrane_domain-containing protein [Hexamita inflata]|uniref:Transmembrane domain-containing protein n=1 Tax=Hexamita inflata TaxID=28002 RepID=A0AA86N7K3_9EUKA|nr:Transmembrane domain-containing protein [Hexamita inflata]CAI9934687.1 Transmembrane domain-containing protein [Hexamita inflata]
MSQEDFINVDPAKLTIQQLKQAIGIFGGQQVVGPKKDQIEAFTKAREQYQQSQQSNTQELKQDDFDEPKTQKIEIPETPPVQVTVINNFAKQVQEETRPQPNYDLTQTAFQITGVLPVSNAAYVAQLQKENNLLDQHTSPPKQLKANIDFEKTPQSVIRQSDILEQFVQSNYIPQESILKTKNYSITNEFDDHLKFTEINTFKENADGLADDQEVKKIKKSVHFSPEVNLSKEKEAPVVSRVTKSPLKLQDLAKPPVQQVRRQIPTYKKPSFINRQISLYHTISISKQTCGIISAVILALVMLFSIIVSVALRQNKIIPLSKTPIKIISFFLPKSYVNESTSYSLLLQNCPPRAICINNTIIGCEPTFTLKKINKFKAKSDFGLKNHNNKVNLNRKIHVMLNKQFETDEFTATNVNYTLHKTLICGRNKIQRKHLVNLMHTIEEEILNFEGQYKCSELRKVANQQAQSLFEEQNKNYLLLNISAFQILSQQDKDLLIDKINNDKDDIAEFTQSLQFSVDNDNILVKSTNKPNLSLGCKISFNFKLRKQAFVQTVFSILAVISSVGYLTFQIKLRNYVIRRYKKIKTYLKNVKEQEQNTNGSSVVSYAIRSEALKHQFVGDTIFINWLWPKIEKKLASDYQIEKQWIRARNGEATEAYYYNGEGIVQIRKEASAQEEGSEHSISY